eukprot:6192469-Pyramimonas_sp.AAC.1
MGCGQVRFSTVSTGTDARKPQSAETESRCQKVLVRMWFGATERKRVIADLRFPQKDHFVACAVGKRRAACTGL